MKYHVLESMEIHATLQAVKEAVFDLREWESWSPWLCLEPMATTTNHNEGVHLEDYLYWNGKIIGEGKMQVVSRSHDSLSCRLTFFKPFKSVAMSKIVLIERKDGVMMQWSMEGNLPFFLFFLKPTMKAFIPKDYRRGLLRVKNLVERGEIPAKLEFFDDLRHMEPFYFVGKRSSASFDALASTMKSDLQAVIAELKEKAHEAKAMTLYHKVDIVKDRYEYSIGFAFAQKPHFTAGNLEFVAYPPHQAIMVRLVGSYDFLSDAWTGIMMHLRAQKYKIFKKFPRMRSISRVLQIRKSQKSLSRRSLLRQRIAANFDYNFITTNYCLI